ncbi:hypothetical protein BS47DRAFT_1260811, partial [Hydnum rufescens UP504]
SLPRGGCSIIAQLRSGHIALRDYLERFGHADSPLCLRCALRETPEHYLVFCARFMRER